MALGNKRRLKLVGQPAYFEVLRRFAKYGYGTMLYYHDGVLLHEVQFTPEDSDIKTVINKELHRKFKDSVEKGEI